MLPEYFHLVSLRSIQSVVLSTFHVYFRMVLPWKRSGFLDRSTGRLIFLRRFIDEDDSPANPSVFRIVEAKWGPRTNRNRFTFYYRALSFRVLTLSLLFLVVGVSATFVRDWSGKDKLIFLSSGSRTGRLIWYICVPGLTYLYDM